MEADEKKAPALARQGSANTSVSGPVTATPAGQEDASDKVTAQSDFHEFAKQCLCNGLSVIPATADKRPDILGGKWKPYQQHLPLVDEVDEWFYPNQPYGLGIVCGAVSGGLEVLDLDAKHDPAGTLNARAEAAIKEFAPGLWEKMPRETTPSGGLHLYFRSESPDGNLKLARAASGREAIAETRGEGGFIVAAPTPGYNMVNGSLAEIPILTAEERDSLLAATRSLDISEPVEVRAPPTMRGAALTPLDDYNRRGDVLALMRKHDWGVGPECPDRSRKLRRPGKEHGVSASWNHGGRGKLCVFSSSTEFDVAPSTYSPAGVFAVLECNGDFSLAAAELRRLGFGADAQTTTHADQVPDSDTVTTAGPRSFTIWKPSQFLTYTPPPDSIILGDSVMERGKLTSLVGVGGLGKTRLALFLAICQILGLDWCALKVQGKPLRWLILSTENGLRRWQTDLGAMLAARTEAERALVDENLAIMAMTEDEDGDINTGSPESMKRLSLTLSERKADVIVFDPFADMIDGDENKTQDVVSTLRTLRQIVRKAAANAAVLLIHHARTGASNVVQAGDNFNAGNFARGAKALYSAVRAEIQLAPGDRDNANMVVMLCGKNSDGPKFAPRGVIFNADDCSYTLDPSFDLGAWRADVSGKRTGRACSIADAVEAVRFLAPNVGDEAKTKDIVEAMMDASAASSRTCKERLAEALKLGYLRRGSRSGMYRLGSKPLSK
jgi:hypothetical protein